AVVELTQVDPVARQRAPRSGERRLRDDARADALDTEQDQGARTDRDRVRPVGEEREPGRAPPATVVRARVRRAGRTRRRLEDAARRTAPPPLVDQARPAVRGDAVLVALRGGDETGLALGDGEELGRDGGERAHPAIRPGAGLVVPPLRVGPWTVRRVLGPVDGGTAAARAYRRRPSTRLRHVEHGVDVVIDGITTATPCSAGGGGVGAT